MVRDVTRREEEHTVGRVLNAEIEEDEGEDQRPDGKTHAEEMENMGLSTDG